MDEIKEFGIPKDEVISFKINERIYEYIWLKEFIDHQDDLGPNLKKGLIKSFGSKVWFDFNSFFANSEETSLPPVFDQNELENQFNYDLPEIPKTDTFLNSRKEVLNYFDDKDEASRHENSKNAMAGLAFMGHFGQGDRRYTERNISEESKSKKYDSSTIQRNIQKGQKKKLYIAVSIAASIILSIVAIKEYGNNQSIMVKKSSIRRKIVKKRKTKTLKKRTIASKKSVRKKKMRVSNKKKKYNYKKKPKRLKKFTRKKSFRKSNTYKNKKQKGKALAENPLNERDDDYNYDNNSRPYEQDPLRSKLSRRTISAEDIDHDENINGRTIQNLNKRSARRPASEDEDEDEDEDEERPQERDGQEDDDRNNPETTKIDDY